MRPAAKIIAIVALALTILPPLLFLMRVTPEATMKHLMIAGCLLWFVSAPLAMQGGSK